MLYLHHSLRSKIPLPAHFPGLVSAQGPFKTHSSFHISSRTCFLFLFCLFYPSLSSCVGSVNLVLDLCFCDSKLPFQHEGYNLQPGHVQFIPISAGPYWFMSMHKIFHLSYNIAVGCNCLVVVIKANPIAHVVDPT